MPNVEWSNSLEIKDDRFELNAERKRSDHSDKKQQQKKKRKEFSGISVSFPSINK